MSLKITKGNIEINVLQGINLIINKGEFISIMGPSGSGKSTLLYLIGGLDILTSGSVKINDVELVKLSDKEKAFFVEENWVCISIL